MNEYVPEPWTFTLLALASWRVFVLISNDKLLEKPVDLLLRQLRPQARRDYWRDFLECPYCLGFWISVGWWLAWLQWPDGATIAAVPWALSMTLALGETAKNAMID